MVSPLSLFFYGAIIWWGQVSKLIAFVKNFLPGLAVSALVIAETSLRLAPK